MVPEQDQVYPTVLLGLGILVDYLTCFLNAGHGSHFRVLANYVLRSSKRFQLPYCCLENFKEIAKSQQEALILKYLEEF